MRAVSASLIKEWCWCRTFAWFVTLGLKEPIPPHAADPEEWSYHEVAEGLLTYYRLEGVEYNVLVRHKLVSRKLGIYGIADLVLLAEDGRDAVVAEVKTTSPWVSEEHVDLQVTAYAVMAKETFGVRSVRAYAISKAEYREVAWARYIPRLVEVIRNLKRMLDTEEMPPPNHDGLRCRACPYRRLCPYSKTSTA